MSLMRFILYSLIAFFVIRLVMKFLYTNHTPRSESKKSPSNDSKKSSEKLEKPKFNIEAESVEFEVIDQNKNQNEEKKSHF